MAIPAMPPSGQCKFAPGEFVMHGYTWLSLSFGPQIDLIHHEGTKGNQGKDFVFFVSSW